MSDDYMTSDMCKAVHAESLILLTALKKSVDNLAKAQDETSKHLFQDNGSKSIQTRINDNSTVINTLCRAMWVIYGVLITAVVGGMIAGAVAVAKHIYGAGG